MLFKMVLILSKLKNIVGIKEASGNFSQIAEIVFVRQYIFILTQYSYRLYSITIV